MSDEKFVRDESMDVRDILRQRQLEQAKTLEHGAYVPGENGEAGGIYIDKEEVLRQQTALPQLEHIQEYLSDMDKKISAAQNPDEKKDTKMQEQTIIKKSNQLSPDMADIAKVSQIFSSFEESSTGLAPVGSSEAQEFKKKMNDLETGKVDIEKINEYVQAHPEGDNHIDYVEPEKAVVEEAPVHTVASNVVADSDIVQFNVDSKHADTFMTTLSMVEREKVAKSSSIVVNEIKSLEVPVTTRTITSMDEFKRVLPRQSHSGVVETVCINSGFVARFKGCGALAMATLVPEDIDSGIDYAAQYNFCYEYLVDTSIGKMSYHEFCVRTHVNDIPAMLFAILRASEPDKNSIMLECANCKTSYEVPYALSELLDLDSIDEEMSQRIDEIVSARNILDDAMKVHQNSPIMNSKFIQFDMDYQKITVELKPTNGNIVIERIPLMNAMIKKYSRFVAGIIPFIPSVRLEFIPEGETEPQVYQITDPTAIAEVIRDLDTDYIRAIGEVLSKIKEYPTPTYSFKAPKGKPYICPKCGRKEERVPCTVESLIFYRVEQAIR